jgi:hypothetical protein
MDTSIMAKRNTRINTEYTNDKLAFNAMSWCLKKGIKIYAVPLENKYSDGKYGKNWCKIEIDQQGIKRLGKNWYRQDQLRQAILELYIQIYRRG